MKLFFASHNLDKKREIEYILEGKIKVLYINDFKDFPEIEEKGTTLQENALIKARNGYDYTGLYSFADDTGLEVDILGGDPGVFTARYAGADATYRDNYQKLLKEMTGVPMEKRTARFRTAVVFYRGDTHDVFEGVCEGRIALNPSGESGFGYDPVFIPDGFEKTFAELESQEKNRISHRAIAVTAFAAFMKKFNGV